MLHWICTPRHFCMHCRLCCTIGVLWWRKCGMKRWRSKHISSTAVTINALTCIRWKLIQMVRVQYDQSEGLMALLPSRTHLWFSKSRVVWPLLKFMSRFMIKCSPAIAEVGKNYHNWSFFSSEETATVICLVSRSTFINDLSTLNAVKWGISDFWISGECLRKFVWTWAFIFKIVVEWTCSILLTSLVKPTQLTGPEACCRQR